MARDPEREFGEARSRLDRGEELAAVAALDRARKGFAKRGDVEGLEHVLALAELVGTEDERTAAARANLEYAAKQNLRLATRRAALSAGAPWTDPYPDLVSPSEHTRVLITRRVKIAIAVGVVIGLVVIGAYIAAAVYYGSTSTVGVVVVNDLPRPVEVRWCADASCDDVYESHDLDPSGSTELDMGTDDALDMLVVRNRSDRRLGCLPLRVRDAFDLDSEKPEALRVLLSTMTPCPGEPVLPEPLYDASAA